MKTIPAWFTGEFLGTFLMVFFGCGAVSAAVLLGAQVGVFQVAIVWGLGLAMAIYLAGGRSGAHFNPAVTISLAAWSGFPWRRVGPYIAAQLLGALAAAAVLYLVFGDALRSFEAAHQIVRGQPGSEASAMVFGEYFPNPGGKPLTEDARRIMSAGSAFLAEVIGTALLMVVVCWAGGERNPLRSSGLVPVMVGLSLTVLISLLGPLTMACFNPARDLGPRVFSALAGWGAVPFTTNGHGWLTVYIVAPIVGALLGGGIWRGGGGRS
jgi:glycerol uptake facilitator protein